jgi:hypothetical protein
MSEQLLKVRIEPDEASLPFSEEAIFKAIAENLDRIQTDSEEPFLLVVGPIAMLLHWESDQVVVDEVLRSEELPSKLER